LQIVFVTGTALKRFAIDKLLLRTPFLYRPDACTFIGVVGNAVGEDTLFVAISSEGVKIFLPDIADVQFHRSDAPMTKRRANGTPNQTTGTMENPSYIEKATMEVPNA
jgi:hypothetical protein